VKSDGLAKLYDTLTLDERFRLRAQAWARWDQADMERLDRTCPLGQYDAYCARLEAAGVLTLGVLAELLPKLAKLRMVSAVQPLVAHLEATAEDSAMKGFYLGFQAGWRAAGKRTDAPDISDDALTEAAERAYRLGNHLSDVLDELTTTLATSARTPRDGLAAFCQDDLGLPLDVVLGAWGRPALAELSEYAETLDAVEPNSDEIELFGRVLRIAWRREGLHDQSAEDQSAEFDDELRAAIEAACGEDS
jgi:hypothetical protein